MYAAVAIVFASASGLAAASAKLAEQKQCMQCRAVDRMVSVGEARQLAKWILR